MRRILALLCVVAFVGVVWLSNVGFQEDKKTTFRKTETKQESEPYFEPVGEEVLE